MQNYIIPEKSEVISILGNVQLQTTPDQTLQISDVIDAGTILTLSENSEILVLLEDGTQQRIVNVLGEIEVELNAQAISSNEQASDSVLDEIAAIQSQISTGGDDIELPDTAAGIVGNEGADFVSVDRIGDELLAQAGFDTAGLDNNFQLPEQTDILLNNVDVLGLNGVSSNSVPPPAIPEVLSDEDENESTVEDTSLTGNVLNNVSNANGAPSVTDFTVEGTIYAVGTTVALTVGALTLNGDGSYTFTPNANFNGTVPAVNYTVVDGVGDTDNSTLNISVTPVNDAPLATDDNFNVDQGESVSGNVITHNDGDGAIDNDGGDGSTLFVTQVNGIDLVFNSVGIAEVIVQGGVLQINANGDFTYNNADGFLLGANYPEFEYTLSDGADTDTATVIITVNDSAPVAVDDNNYILLKKDSDGLTIESRIKGNVITFGSSGDNEDSSSDGVIILTQVKFNNVYVFDQNNTSFQIQTDYGQLTINDDGSYRFSLDAGLDPSAVPEKLEFEYTIQDGDVNNPETDSAILTIWLTIPQGRSANVDDGELIDLSNSLSIDNITSNESENNVFLPELSDLLIDRSLAQVENYLALGESENGVAESYTDLYSENFEVDGMIILDNSESSTEPSQYEQVNNALLEEGAVIVSDSSLESTPILAEIDSSDLL